MEDEICPYATFHLLGFREEMDPSKALNFQTFPHQNGMGGPAHVGTLGPNGPMPVHMHSRSGSQSMVSVLFHVRLLIYLLFILTWLKFKLCSTSCFSIRFSHPLATTTKQLLCISVKHPLNNTHTCIPSDCWCALVVCRAGWCSSETCLLNLLSWLATSTEPVREEEQPRWPELHLHSRPWVRRSR